MILGTLICVAITIVLAILVLLLLSMPNIDMDALNVPAIFQITKIRHENDAGTLTYDSYVVVKNMNMKGYAFQDLYARTYRNGNLLNCAIPTLYGHDFIDGSRHIDVQLLGSQGKTWYSLQAIYIDYEDRTFHPGDMVTFEVYDRKSDTKISSHTFKA